MAFRSKLISSSKFIVQNPATLFSSSRSLSLLNGAQYAAAKGNNESDKETHTGQVGTQFEITYNYLIIILISHEHE